MRVISLNLDYGDAAVLRRMIGRALAGCACAETEGGRPCPDCQALGAMMADLDRLVDRPALRRSPSTLLNSPACRRAGLAAPPELARSRRLRVVAGAPQTCTDRRSR